MSKIARLLLTSVFLFAALSSAAVGTVLANPPGACGPGEHDENGVCVPNGGGDGDEGNPCPPSEHEEDGTCVPNGDGGGNGCQNQGNGNGEEDQGGGNQGCDDEEPTVEPTEPPTVEPTEPPTCTDDCAPTDVPTETPVCGSEGQDPCVVETPTLPSGGEEGDGPNKLPKTAGGEAPVGMFYGFSFMMLVAAGFTAFGGKEDAESVDQIYG